MEKIVQIYKSFDPADTEEYTIVQSYAIDDDGIESGTIDWEAEDGAILRVEYKESENAQNILNDVMNEYVSRGLALESVSDGVTIFSKNE